MCIVDNQLTSFVSSPLSSLTGKLDSFLNGAIDKVTFVQQGIEEVTDKIFCNIQGVLDSLLQVIGQVTSALDSLEDAKEMMDAWKSGEKIFSDATNLRWKKYLYLVCFHSL